MGSFLIDWPKYGEVEERSIERVDGLVIILILIYHYNISHVPMPRWLPSLIPIVGSFDINSSDLVVSTPSSSWIILW